MQVRVAACQTPADVERPDQTLVQAAVREAADAGARLIVLPEQAVSGCCFRDAGEARAAAEPSDGPTVQFLQALSSETDSVLVAGYCERDSDGEVYNSAVVVDAGRVAHNYRKVHLWGAENRWFTPGREVPIAVDTRAGRVAAMICYDLEIPEFVRLAALDGADIVAAPCNWPWLPRPATERPLELIKAQAAAGTNKVHIVVADRCGPERGTEWIGGTAIIDATGYLLAGPATTHGESAQPAVLVADLDLDAARDKRLGPHNDAFVDRRPELYAGLS